MAHLTCSLLGTPKVGWANGREITLPTRQETALLAYLAVEQERTHSRSALMSLLWGEKTDRAARNSLRQTLFRLRQALSVEEQTAVPFLLISPQMVQFNPQSPHTLDLRQFTHSLDRWEAHDHEILAACPACLDRLERAVTLYQGAFLDGFTLDASPAFEEWAIIWRERLHRRLLDALYHLAQAYIHRGEHQRARRYAWQQVALEPWREEAHRQLMEAMARGGHLQEALAQYQTCRTVLQQEFKMPPSDETRALYERIRAMPRILLRNFPSSVTSFVGRTEEMARLSALLSSDEIRLLTILGFGGVGKTRLAVEAARQHGRAFLNGAAFVPLAGAAPEENLALTIGAALGISFRDGRPAQQLLNHLQAKEMLLVLDNFEHLTAGVSLVRQLLSHAPRVKIIVTSRAALRLQGEWLFPLEGLAVESETGDQTQADAVRLFVQHARQVNPLFSESAVTSAAAARVCALLAGNPLAIELAASSLGFDDVETLERSLADNLTHLRSMWRDTPTRQRSLQATLLYSWRLLTAEERRVMRQLAVFRSGFSVEAACAVTQTQPQLLAALVQKSLARQVDVERYDLHPLVRHFASERLRASEAETQAAERRHAIFFTDLLHAQADRWHSTAVTEALAAINRESDNVRAAWRRAACLNLRPALARALESFYRWVMKRGILQEGIHALDSALNQVKPPQEKSDVLLGRILARRGMLAFYLGRHDEARAGLEESLACLGDAGSPGDIAFAQNGLAILACTRGAFHAAVKRYDAALAGYRAAGALWGVATVLNNRAILARIRGAYERANGWSRESLTLAQQVGDVTAQARALQNLGIVAYCQKQFAEARRLYAKSLALFREIGEPWETAVALGNLGEVCTDMGMPEEARAFLEESLSLRREMGDRVGTAIALNALGGLAITQGEEEQAEAYLVEALRLAMDADSEPLALEALVSLAQVWANRACYDWALEALALALTRPGCEANVRERAEQQW
ncbi:MAG: tetratricopeptide repeat protein [Anaerolineae bacterium]